MGWHGDAGFRTEKPAHMCGKYWTMGFSSDFYMLDPVNSEYPHFFFFQTKAMDSGT